MPKAKITAKNAEKLTEVQFAFETFLKKEPEFAELAKHAGKRKLFTVFSTGYKKGKASK